ncbi:hypothetical protein CANINC_003188 [Pichia inconspicua]|uniref:Uncharacterized protein n=1 Tax=Pichia inconspicua TaxID=52247 RepID=A0A4T0X0W3_9ASCO|nr:hypothetical protein CANINC_003188 [[Candida] inconspicua]
MKFCSNSVLKNRSTLELESVASPACFLLTTKQFLEAYASGYDDFEFKDLYAAASRILRVQMYQLYRLVKTSHTLKHKLKNSFISQSFYDVTPMNFEPDQDEIELYVKNPRVIFRYSTWNHDTICRLFDAPKLRGEFTINVKTYEHDFSQIVPYLKTKHLTGAKKSFFKSKQKTDDEIDLNYVKDSFMKYFKYELKEHECIEYLFSDDFYNHGLHVATTYMDFVCALLTGSFEISTNGENCRYFTALATRLDGTNDTDKKFLNSITNDPAATKAYKMEAKCRQQEEKKQRKIEKENSTLARKQFKAQYKAQIEAEKKFRKSKGSISPDDVPNNSFGQILRSGFDSLSSNSFGRIARKNAILNRGVSIASTTVDTIHRQAMRGVERTLRLKRKRSIIFADESENEVNAEYEDQSFLRSYIEEVSESIYIPNGVDSESIASDFDMKDYVGTKVYPDGHSIVKHLTSNANKGRKRMILSHPLIVSNDWLYTLMSEEQLGYYPFIIKLLGKSCQAENTEIECNYGALTMRTPWVLPIPHHRLDFIKKSYSTLVPSHYWNRAAMLDSVTSDSDRKYVKITKAVDAWIDDYQKVFDHVDEAYKLEELEKLALKKARITQIEDEKLKKQIEEQSMTDDNLLNTREIDHVVDDLESESDNEIANTYINEQFNDLFGNEKDFEQSTTKISRRLINEKIRNARDNEEIDELNSLNVQYDSDIEIENLFENKRSKNVMVEKTLDRKLRLKEQCGTGQNEKIVKKVIERGVHKNSDKPKSDPRWLRKQTSLNPERIDFDLSGTRYLPKLCMPAFKELHPRFRKFNKELHKKFKKTAVIDYSPFIARPEMTWCILSGTKNDHVIDNYIQAMHDRFSSMYVSLMKNINNSNVDFTYDDKQYIKDQIELRNKTTPNFCDLRIIPFDFGDFVYNEEFITMVACYLTSFFVKHNPHAIINPLSYRDQIMDSMKASKRDSLAIFIYAKDCHLFELYFANSYLNYAREHINENNEFKGNTDRIGRFNLFNFAFDELYVPYYRILDTSFNEVFDSYLVHYEKSSQGCEYFIDDNWIKNRDNNSDIKTDVALKFGNFKSFDIIGYESSFDYRNDLKSWLCAPVF